MLVSLWSVLAMIMGLLRLSNWAPICARWKFYEARHCCKLGEFVIISLVAVSLPFDRGFTVDTQAKLQLHCVEKNSVPFGAFHLSFFFCVRQHSIYPFILFIIFLQGWMTGQRTSSINITHVSDAEGPFASAKVHGLTVGGYTFSEKQVSTQKAKLDKVLESIDTTVCSEFIVLLCEFGCLCFRIPNAYASTSCLHMS